MKYLLFVLLQLFSINLCIANNETFTGTYFVNPVVRSSKLIYNFQTDTTIYTLDFSKFGNAPEGISSSLTGTVDGIISTVLKNTIIVDSFTVNSFDGADIVDFDIKSIAYVVSFCGLYAIDMTKMQSNWNPGMNNYLQGCSFNKITFNPAKNIIVGPIDVPCTSQNMNLLSCDLTTLISLANYLNNYAQTVLNIDITKYKHRLVMLPVGNTCTFGGLGDVGCASFCNSWYNGNSGLQLEVIAHELGHNLGLMHSTTPGNEYGDGSCIMGLSIGARCFNAPQSWKLNVSYPLVTYDDFTLTSNIWNIWTIYEIMFIPNSFIKINPTWSSSFPSSMSYYISYRSKYGYDANLLPQWIDQVYIHQFSRETNIFDYTKPVLISQLNSSYTQHILFDIGVIVNYINMSVPTSATIKLCRQYDPSLCTDSVVINQSPSYPSDKSPPPPNPSSPPSVSYYYPPPPQISDTETLVCQCRVQKT